VLRSPEKDIERKKKKVLVREEGYRKRGGKENKPEGELVSIRRKAPRRKLIHSPYLRLLQTISARAFGCNKRKS